MRAFTYGMALLAFAGVASIFVLPERPRLRNVAVAELDDGKIGLTFRPNVSVGDLESVIAALDRRKKVPDVTTVFFFGNGENADVAAGVVRAFPGIRTLQLDAVPISEETLQLIARLKQVQRLILHSGALLDDIEEGAFVESTLEIVEVDASMLTDSIVRALARAPNLRRLNI